MADSYTCDGASNLCIPTERAKIALTGALGPIAKMYAERYRDGAMTLTEFTLQTEGVIADFARQQNEQFERAQETDVAQHRHNTGDSWAGRVFRRR